MITDYIIVFIYKFIILTYKRYQRRGILNCIDKLYTLVYITYYYIYIAQNLYTKFFKLTKLFIIT